MPSKLIEDLYYQKIYETETVSSAGTLYNGTASSVAGVAIDCQDAEDINILVNVGAITGDGTLDLTLYESDTDLPSGATAISSAAFTQFTSSHDSGLYVASILAEVSKRYLWVRSVKGGTGNVPVSIIAALKRRKLPETQGNTPDFDLDSE